MPFVENKLRDGQGFNWDSHYNEVIERAIKDIGMIPRRADAIGAEPYLDRLWNGIQEAEVIVADVTGRNSDVFYALGLAQAIGKRILILTMEPDDVPVAMGKFIQIRYSREDTGLRQLARELPRHLEAARKEPSAEVMLMPLPGAAGGGAEPVLARVLHVTPSFATVEAQDGRRGFLNVEDFSWKRRPRDLTRDLREGQELNGAFVVDLNGQPRFSLLAHEENPWPKLEREIPVGSSFRGVVVKSMPGVGLFVEMKYGIRGLIPDTQVPRDIGPGSEVRAQVERIDPTRREVRLRYVELAESSRLAGPGWGSFFRGQSFEGIITRVEQDRGYALVQVTDDTAGLLPIARMTPQFRDRFLSQDLKAGDKVAVEIVEVDEVRRRLVLRNVETPPGDSARRFEQVQFTAYSPRKVLPLAWNPLIAYCHMPEARLDIDEDSRFHLGQDHAGFEMSSTQHPSIIAREAEIVVVPFLHGCRFNPQQASVGWLERWHRIEFRFQALPELPGFALDVSLSGRLDFFVGPVLVGEIGFQVEISETSDPVAQGAAVKASAKPFQAVFVSYSHADSLIVDRLEQACEVLGMEYLRDVHILRSGEEWQTRLLAMIERADIFQLCWSQTAKHSTNVEKEWRHALKQRRRSFIRPIYWEIPMPDPPVELADLHFGYYRLP
jgi:predicted RNA-binding protein with RPS1 domain